MLLYAAQFPEFYIQLLQHEVKCSVKGEREATFTIL